MSRKQSIYQHIKILKTIKPSKKERMKPDLTNWLETNAVKDKDIWIACGTRLLASNEKDDRHGHCRACRPDYAPWKDINNQRCPYHVKLEILPGGEFGLETTTVDSREKRISVNKLNGKSLEGFRSYILFMMETYGWT